MIFCFPPCFAYKPWLPLSDLPHVISVLSGQALASEMMPKPSKQTNIKHKEKVKILKLA
tara:strand:- start:391 stop:567 length:177 start_codon:yes stop_codon:yes gene_type:complete